MQFLLLTKAANVNNIITNSTNRITGSIYVAITVSAICNIKTNNISFTATQIKKKLFHT